MSDIQAFTGGPSRPARRAARAISRNQVTAQVRISGVDASTDVTNAKIENVSLATGTAMRAVVAVTKLQENLEALAPAAAGKLAFLSDDHTLGMGELLADLRRDLRRR